MRILVTNDDGFIGALMPRRIVTDQENWDDVLSPKPAPKPARKPRAKKSEVA